MRLAKILYTYITTCVSLGSYSAFAGALFLSIVFVVSALYSRQIFVSVPICDSCSQLLRLTRFLIGTRRRLV